MKPGQYRIDYVTKNGERGVWEYEHEYSSLNDVQKIIPETLAYAKSKISEIKRLVVVEMNEKDID